MADILMVQPQIGDWDTVRSHPSVPLSILSACRLASTEFETVLIDTRLDKQWRDTLTEELGKNPLCVGITSMTGRQIGHALAIARHVKRVSTVPVVLGGIHASLLPESTLENDNIDIVVAGEGELTFQELVRTLARKESLRTVAGIHFKDGGKPVKNPPRPLADLDSLPPLPLHLLAMDRYLPLFMNRRTMYLETSRGCPNRCFFCYNTIYNSNTWRAFSAERVLEELKNLVVNHNISSFYLIDDNFFVNLARARKIAEGIIAAGLDINYEIQGICIESALRMTDADLELFTASGMKKVHFGVESGSETILKRINKRIRIDDVMAVNKSWSRHDIVIQYNFMCGFPQETRDDIRQTTELLFRLMDGNRHALISPLCPFTPYPGTVLYDEALRQGFIHKKSLEEWQQTDYGDNIWGSAEKARVLGRLFFASMFLDSHRAMEMIDSKLFKLLITLYRPVAKFRIRHLFFSFMPEIWLKRILFREE